MKMDLLTQWGFICEADMPQKKIFRRKDVAVKVDGCDLIIEYDFEEIYTLQTWTEADLLVPVWLSYMNKAQRRVVEEVVGRPNLHHLPYIYKEEKDVHRVVADVMLLTDTKTDKQ